MYDWHVNNLLVELGWADGWRDGDGGGIVGSLAGVW